MRGIGIITVCLLQALISLGCHREAAESTELASPNDDPAWFRDDTDEVSLSFHHEAGPIGRNVRFAGTGGAEHPAPRTRA